MTKARLNGTLAAIQLIGLAAGMLTIQVNAAQAVDSVLTAPNGVTGTIALSDAAQLWSGVQDFTGATVAVKDGASFAIKNTADATKVAEFDASGITTATTRTYTLPNASGTLALLGLAQTWTAQQDFTGTTTLVATATLGDNTTKAASTAFVTAAIAASGGTNPMTTLGDTIYGGASGAETRRAGNTTTTPMYLKSVGSGGLATAPVWAQVAFADLSGSVAAGQMPALTGDVTSTAGTVATTLTTTQAGAHTWSAIQTISNSTASTSTASGALVVTGGVGIGGAVNIGSGANNIIATMSGATTSVGTTFSTVFQNTGGTNRTAICIAVSNPSSASSASIIAIDARADLAGSGTVVYTTGSLTGISGTVRLNTGAATGTIATAVGGSFQIQSQNAVTTVSNAFAIQVLAPQVTGPIGANFGIQIRDMSPAGVTTGIALSITNQTSGKAISTGVGVVSFGDSTSSTSTTTGAVVITGGVGIGGALNVGKTVGILAAANADTALNIGSTLTGSVSTTQIGIASQVQPTSSATTSYMAMYCRAASATAAYTQASTYGAYIDTPIQGAGSTMTTLYGLYVAAQNLGGTNYAIYTNAGLVRFGDNAAILATPNADTVLRMSGALANSVAAGQIGIDLESVPTSSATGSMTQLYMRNRSAAAAYTQGAAYCAYIDTTNYGSGSTVTAGYGVYIANQTGAGTNYAIYTNTGTVRFGDVVQTASAQESTGAGSALLAANCPAVTITAPYKWIKGLTSDGSTVYWPVWK